MPTLVAFLEVPGVVIGLLLARAQGGGFREALREVLVGRSVFLLAGGLLVGFLSGEEGMQKVKAFFVDPFNRALTLFLMELGTVAARRLQDVARLMATSPLRHPRSPSLRGLWPFSPAFRGFP